MGVMESGDALDSSVVTRIRMESGPELRVCKLVCGGHVSVCVFV